VAEATDARDLIPAAKGDLLPKTTPLDDAILSRFFNHPDLTTETKFWNLHDTPTYPTIHIPKDVTLNLDGKVEHFPDGAYVFKKPDGKLSALSSKQTSNGGLTLDGYAVPKDMTQNRLSSRFEGNMTVLNIDGEKGKLQLLTTDGDGATYNFPLSTEQELAKTAEASGAVIKALDKRGKVIEGFFVDGQGSVVPREVRTKNDHRNLNSGEFVAISRNANGEVTTLFPFQNYTPEELAIRTREGRGRPGNTLDQLTTIDGQVLTSAGKPRLNLQTGKLS
jgi:hypothetical protein